MQSIETRYLQPTNYRSARVKAIATGGATITTNYHDQSDGEQGAHDMAARTLIQKLGWNDGRRRWVRGATKRGYVYVLIPHTHSELLQQGPRPAWTGFGRTLQRDGKPIASLNIYIGPEDGSTMGRMRTIPPVEADDLSKRIAHLLTEYGQ